MSKLLLSTSMVVALMAMNPALHAEGPEPEFDEITVDQGQEADTAKDETTLNKAEETAVREDVGANLKMEDSINKLKEDESQFSPDAKQAFEDLKNDHEDLDNAIEAAQKATDLEEKTAAFSEIETQLSKVEESASKLSKELTSPDDKKLAQEVLSDINPPIADEKPVDKDIANLENVDETSVEVGEVVEDASLTPTEDMNIANEMKGETNEIQASIDAATEIQKGLEDAGMDVNADKLTKLRKTLENLNAILFDITGPQKGKAVSKK